ncbi:MAG: isoleucine--tRNA ligase [Erysipelotrichaceae bacterium]|nr:isoleucine--tRNA ligase [Erysipelotrichaceae bacterium]
MDYKDTLLMPKTDFEMRGNLAKKEPDIQQKWENLDLYHSLLKTHQGQPTYILHDGPPYANGNLHAGTAMNRIIKDFIVKSHAMNGNYTPFIPGWDTHGLPIENAIQKLGVDRKSLTPADFRLKCEEYALNQISIQKSTMKRLGTLADFDNPYITLQKSFEADQIRSFAKMALAGLIYQGLKPIYWSPARESALAEAEIVYIDKKDPAIFVMFDVLDGKGILNDERFVIWTTTPWTIPANLAISLHPDLDYAIVDTVKGKLIMLAKKVDELLAKFELSGKIIKTIKGKELEYITVKHPFYPDRPSLIILGTHVTDEDGTGCVHTAPGHGADDFYVGQKYGLPAYCPVDEKGCMMSEAGDFVVGQFVEDANKTITKKLDELNALLKLEWITHSYPHDERMKKPVIFRATVQWFASIEKIKDKILKQIKDVSWGNEWGEIRLYNMIKDRGDWCISRQRLWGVPIPIIYTEDDTPIMEKEVFDHIAELFAKFGSNVWFEKDATELLPEGYRNDLSPNGIYRKEKDIMDVWFDSGSSHNVLKARGLDYPADLYFEGSDQYRGWFNSSLIVATATNGQAPYKSVISHGYVCDDKGEKMSKSIGNVVDPIDVIKVYGADILRLWASTIDYKQDVRIGDDILKQVSEQYRKIRNTFRFMLGNVSPMYFDKNKDYVIYQDREAIDQYITVLLNDINHKCINAYMRFNYLEVSTTLTSFMTNDLSSFYLDYIKDIVYIETADSLRRKQVQSVLYDLIETLVRLWAPILSFTTEEIWQYYDHDVVESVHLLSFMPIKEFKDGSKLKTDFERLLAIRDDVNKAIEIKRNEKLIGKSLEADVAIEVTVADQELICKLLKNNLTQFLIVSSAHLESNTDFQQFEVAKVNITKADGKVCPRCWNITKETDDNGLCLRCHDIMLKLNKDNA